MIEKRISNLSSNKEVFDAHKQKYINALNRSGFKNVRFEYQTKDDKSVEENMNKAKTNKKKRDIVWYTPPFSENVKTKVGGTFFYLLQKHFPKESKLHKLINKATVKLSYSSMPSIKRIISNINNAKLNSEQNNVDSSENQVKACTKQGICKNGCIVNGRCMETDVIYKATVTEESMNESVYIGETAETLKKRCGGHYTSFNHVAYKNETTLAKHIWDLQNKNITYQINWEIL